MHKLNAQNMSQWLSQSVKKASSRIKTQLRAKNLCYYNKEQELVPMADTQLQCFRNDIIAALLSLQQSLPYDGLHYIALGFGNLHWETPTYSILIKCTNKAKATLQIALTLGSWCVLNIDYELFFERFESTQKNNKEQIIDSLLIKAKSIAKTEKKDIIIDLQKKENTFQPTDTEYPFNKSFEQLLAMEAAALGFISGAKDSSKNFLKEYLDVLKLDNLQQLEWVLYKLERVGFLTKPDRHGERKIKKLVLEENAKIMNTYPFGYTENGLIKLMNKYAQHILITKDCSIARAKDFLHPAIDNKPQKDVPPCQALIDFAFNQMKWRKIIVLENGAYHVEYLLYSQIYGSELEITKDDILNIYTPTGKIFCALNFGKLGKRLIGAKWKKQDNECYINILYDANGELKSLDLGQDEQTLIKDLGNERLLASPGPMELLKEQTEANTAYFQQLEKQLYGE